MSINFTARQTNITPDLKKYCERRLKSLKKFVGPLTEGDIILTLEKNRHRAEIKVKAGRKSFNVTEETHDMYNSLNLAFDNLEKRVKKEREKLRERKRRKSREKEAFPVSFLPEERRKVIPSRDFSLKPMTVEEAIIQLETANKSVFVFRKSGSEKWAVIFRRSDDNIGLIEPE